MERAVVVHHLEAVARLRIDRELTAGGWALEDPHLDKPLVGTP